MPVSCWSASHSTSGCCMSGVPEACAAGQVICRSGTFIHAVQKMQRALFEFHVRGVKVRTASALQIRNRNFPRSHALLRPPHACLKDARERQ